MTCNRALLAGLFAALSFGLAARAHEAHAHAAPWDQASAWPDRIVASPGEDPARGFTVTWRTDDTVDEAIAEIVRATAAARFDLGSDAFNAQVEGVDLESVVIDYGATARPNGGRGRVHYHSVVFGGLEPDTLYAYRVRGARGAWSEWFQLRTAPLSGPVAFLYFGDAQRGVRSHWSRAIRAGHETAPEARFIVHAGDLVNQGERDTEWAEWFAAGGFIHAVRPVIPVAGNHEYVATEEGGVSDGGGQLTTLWRPQFTLPVEAELPEALYETVYDIRYTPDLHIFALDSSSTAWDAQMDWLARTAGGSDARWKIVVLHHSPFRPGISENAAALANRDRLLAVAEQTGVSVILAGHNHSYTRASYGEGAGGRAVLGDPADIDLAVIVSASGGMSGRLTAERFVNGNEALGDNIELERWGNNTPTFQVIAVDGGRLDYQAYTLIGELYDAFTLERSEDGALTLANGEAAFGETRHFEVTEPYDTHNRLR